jgi:plastocyanin
MAVALPVTLAGPAAAANQTVTIGANGFVPKDVSILVGETVTFVNSDRNAHQVEFKGSGVTCTSSPFVLAAGATGSCSFAAAGTFTYSDPNEKGGTYRGSVTVTTQQAATGSATIKASAPLVVYGAKVTLSGTVSPAKGAVAVDLWARPYPEQAFTKVASVASGGDGSYAFALPPQVRTEYKVQFTDGGTKGESPAVTVQVRPKVTLSVKSVSGGSATLRTGVVSTLTYAGKPLLLQRRNSEGGWTTVRTLKLGQFSTATVKVRLPARTTKWRTYLQEAQAGAGYVASWSPTRRVVR